MKSHGSFLLHSDQTVHLCGLKFPLEYLYRGCLVTGSPGSGKTMCVLLPLLKSILQTTGNNPQNKCGLMVADPKNEIAPIIEEMLASVGRSEDLVLVQPGKSWYNPLHNPLLPKNEIIEKIVSWGNNTHRSADRRARGESEFWAQAQHSLLSALVSTTLAIHGVLNFALLNQVFRQVCRFDGALEATRWLEKVHVPNDAVRGICDFVSLPRESTRPCVAQSVSGVLFFWDQEPLRTLITPDASTPAVDPIDVINNGKVLVVGCSGAAFGAAITPLLLSLKEHAFNALLSRDKIEVEENGSWKQINQTRPVFLINDEFQSYISTDASTGELIAADRLRGFNSGLICVTQNISSLVSVLGDIHHSNRLVSLLSNQVFLSNICPETAHLAEHILGRKKVREYQRDCTPQLAPPTLFRNAKPRRRRSGRKTVESTRDVPRVDAAALARLRTGQFWIRLADGHVYKKNAPWPQSFDAIN